MTTYYISAGNTWEKTKAKTLRGAKNIASKTFAQEVGVKIEVGVEINDNAENACVEPVAVKYGYDKWLDNAC